MGPVWGVRMGSIDLCKVLIRIGFWREMGSFGIFGLWAREDRRERAGRGVKSASDDELRGELGENMPTWRQYT